MKIVCVILVALFSTLVVAQGDNCNGVVNNSPMYTGAPTFVNSTANGKLFKQTDVSPALNVLHVYGTPYQMGLAHGTLLKEQVDALFPEFYDYVYRTIEPYLSFLPPPVAHALEKFGVAAALDLTYEWTKPYIPPYFMQEMQGLSDGSGVPLNQIIQIHMFPELIKASCSMYGAWGSATSNTTSPGSLFQLRALDWATDGPFQQFPTVIVYHTEDDNAHPFSILTWSGFIGAVTGYSTAPLGLCEKVWLSYEGESSRKGIPWHFLTRDILQFDVDIDAALSRIASAARTCSIFIGLGDHTGEFVAVQYSHEVVQVNNNYNGPVWDGHPKIKDVVYVDKHKQPSSDPCMGSLLEEWHGSLDAQAAIQLAAIFETGDMHAAVFDYAQHYMWVANASPANATGGGVTPAYRRSFIRLDMDALFAEAPPS